MKRMPKFTFFVLLIGVLIHFSCKKEFPATPVFTLPPSPPSPAPPPVLPLTPPLITNLKLTQFGTLSEPRYHILAATAGYKMLFVGGRYFIPNAWYDPIDATWWNAEISSTRVDIYDTITHIWSTYDLKGSNYDAWSGTAVVGNKIFFAGGYGYNSLDSARIDIYDATSDSWSFINLPIVRRDIAVASLGNKVFFAGGNNGTDFGAGGRVDIYDVSNNSWSAATLSQPRSIISGISFGNKIFFAGGSPSTTRVDIYDGTTQTWSTAELSVARCAIQTAIAGDKLLFDRGDGNSNIVDIYNKSTQTWSSVNANISVPPHFRPTASLENNAFFFVYDQQVNIYNGSTNNWYTAALNPTTSYGHKAAITVGNQIYLGGGFNGNSNSDKVWKVQF
ncbi:MAG: hypothetical protein ABUT20_47650 [Bacteroidota bacterium]